MVDDFDGDAAGYWFVKGPGCVAVNGGPGFFVDFGFEGGFKGFVGIVCAEKVGLADYKWSSYGEYIGEPKIIDADFALSLFNDVRGKAINEFKRFHDTIGCDFCLETDDKKKLRDDEAKDIIKRICKVTSCTKVQLFEPENRNQCLILLKEEGLSTRQIARLTGISRGIILKV